MIIVNYDLSTIPVGRDIEDICRLIQKRVSGLTLRECFLEKNITRSR